MAQLQKGTDYTTGDQVTAVNLDALVDNAILLPGAITDQIAAGSVSSSDTVLINQVGALKKATALQIASTLDLSPYLLKSGGTMAGSLVLYGNPSAALEAATKGYVDAQDASVSATAIAGIALCVARAGDTMTGPLTLPGNPASALQAAPKQYVDQADAILVPTGAIMCFYRSTAPAGWLECNGQSTSGYAALAALIGANVPDLRGEFIRGWDNGRGVDSGRVLGSAQADILKAHNHNVGAFTTSASNTGQGVFNFYAVTSHGGGSSFNGYTTSSNGGTETRPRNIALMYCIKT
jgi:microcystin-dependent protein